IHYTWQSTLLDVSERLGVAENSIELIQEKQANHVRAFSDSYEFVYRINHLTEFDDFQTWVAQQKGKYNLDFLRFHRVDSIADKFRYLDLTRKESFFDVLSHEELKEFGDDLAKRAQIPIRNTQRTESRGLVSRTVITIYTQQDDIIGFLDGGLLLNNSTVLVDQIRDLIYP
ncbi:histidine kinase, partial [Vibrio xuii]